MRVVLFLNGSVGAKVAEYLGKRRGVEIVGLVIHPKAKRRKGEDILKALALPKSRIFDGSKLDQPAVRKRLAALKPEMGISVYFVYILRKPILDLFPRGVVNLHPAFLPWNKGTNTNIWTIVDRTPAGVTLHTVDEGVDTGAILAQAKVPVLPTDDGKLLYMRLERAAFQLFKKSWAKLAEGKLKPIRHSPKAGSRHRFRDVDAIDTSISISATRGAS
jgi:methionyl-tRNA formyltransferase